MAGDTVLVIGGGGREHALAWALRRSARVGEVVCAPGNGGIAALARCIPLDLSDLDDMVQTVLREQPQLTIVGPEAPLALGLVDALQARGLRVFGPTRAAAELESSKTFAKRFMQRHNIPTAKYAVCASPEEALEALDHFGDAVVLKADGLHAGKGVLLCHTRDEAEAAIAGLYSGALLGSKETGVIVEELLEGEELSLLAMCDGRHAALLAPAQDHKRIGEGDTGANTGGMGAYSSDAMLPPEMQEWILHHIVQPTLDGMTAEGTPFAGLLFLGLMMTARGPMVLEYNTRFGDPETQAVLLRLESDLYQALEAAVDGRLSEAEFRWRPGASACVVAASGGYPGKYVTGKLIRGLDVAAQQPDAIVFHAGTTFRDGEHVTSGGRVLGVAATGANVEQALANAYAGMAKIAFDGMYYRRDIGHRALRTAGGGASMILKDDLVVDVPTANGPMRTYFFYPAAGERHPGIILYSEIFQMTSPIRRFATFLAGHGYLVAVPEVYHELEPAGTVLAYDQAGSDKGNHDKYAKELSAYDDDARSLLAYMAGMAQCNGRLGVVGICLGGHIAFRAAMNPAVRAAVCFYATDIHSGTLGAGRQDDSLARAGEIQGELLHIWGRQDPHVPLEGRRKILARLDAVGANYQWLEVNGAHAFMRDEGYRYDPELELQLKAMMLAVFHRRLALGL